MPKKTYSNNLFNKKCFATLTLQKNVMVPNPICVQFFFIWALVSKLSASD